MHTLALQAYCSHTVHMNARAKANRAGIADLLVVILLVLAFVLRAGKGIELSFAFACVAGLVGFLSYRGQDEQRAVSPWILWSLLLFLGWSVLSLGFSQVRTYGLDEVLRDGAGAVLFLWMAQGMLREHRTEVLFRLLTWLTCIACFVGLFVYVLQPVNRFVGVFFHVFDARDYWPNAWAEFLLLAWPLVLWTVRSYEWKKRAFVCGILLAALLLSFSRGATLVLFVQLIALFSLWGMPLLKNGALGDLLRDARKTIAVQTVTILCIAGILFTGANLLRSQFFPVESLAAKATLTASEGTQTVDERSQFWTQAFVLSLQHPFIGWGPYSFRFVQPTLQQQILATSDHPHNIVLKDAMERGWPAAIFFLVFLFAVLLPAKLRLLKQSGQLHMQLFAFVAVVGVVLHNLIDYNLQFVLISLPFWLLLGSLVVDRKAKSAVTPRVQRGTVLLVASVLLLVTILEGRMQALIVLTGDAPGSIFSRDTYMHRAEVLLKNGELSRALDVVRLWQKESPADTRAWNALAAIAMDASHSDEAMTAYANAWRLNPWNDLTAQIGLLRILQARHATDELERMKPLYGNTFDSFALAAEKNTHFVALSPLVDQLLTLGSLLQKVYPDQSSSIARKLHDVRAAVAVFRSTKKEQVGKLWR